MSARNSRQAVVLRWLQFPPVIAWRFLTGKELDGVPVTDAGWFTKGGRVLGRPSAPRPPGTLAAEVHADTGRCRAEWRDLRVRRALGRELRKVERQVLDETGPAGRETGS